MVVFTCNHCGESLQKPRVEKHYAFVCRRTKFLTCVDCLKDFREEEYVAHTKCMTEEERYAAKGSMPNGVVKKGEVKQESWVEMVGSILNKEPNMKPSHRNLLQNILTFSNIPRKKPKFMNFIRSSSGGRVNMKEVEEVWNLIEKYKNNQATVKSENNIKSESLSNGITDSIQSTDKNEKHEKVKKQNPSNGASDGIILVEEVKGSSKTKRKSLDADIIHSKKKSKLEETSVMEEAQSENQKFCFQDKITSVLNSKGRISIKKLEMKVLKAYLKHSGEIEATPKIMKKFHKKLKKIPNVEIEDDYVLLKTSESS